MMRVLLVACCLVGIVLGGAFAPAMGYQAPVSGLGGDDPSGGGAADGTDTEGTGESGSGGADGSGSEGAEGSGSSGSDGSEAAGGSGGAGSGPPGSASGVESYGGVSGGGYPEETIAGGELELSNHPELLVSAPEPSRWRLGAYVTYTGSGFERRSSDRWPVTGTLPTQSKDNPSTEYGIRVEPQQQMDTLVTVWRPAFGDADDRTVSVSEGRALTVREPITPGETYTTTTYGPQSRERAAEQSGRAPVPADIRRRYTQLPDGTPQRIDEQTDSVADDAGADTPFETAEAVERWLEANKEYSLNASHDRSNDVADEFLFEMEAGYCQYFATTMTAMLRTQNIPARYVTGYTAGEQVDENQYLVRGSNAHAWVEVYIADVGWVSFDPTPSDGRADAGRGTETGDRDGSGSESESSSESDSGDETDGQDHGGGSDEADVTGSVDVALTPDPVPGRGVTVTVTRVEEPVSGATVHFNGDPIGETDASGNVTGEVPYTSSHEDRSQLDVSGTGGRDARLSNSLQKLDDRPRFGTSNAPRRSVPPLQADSRNETFSFDVPTEIEIETEGDPVAGSAIDIEATIDDEPVRDGEVSIDNETVTRTDDDGTATIELPEAETAHLVVERDEARGNRTLNLTQPTTERPEADGETSPLQLSVEPALLFALPGTTATLNVTHEDTPVSNATVAVDGSTVGETTADGTFDVSLPLADSTMLAATATVEGEQTTATTTLEGLYRRLATVAVVAFIGLGVLFVSGYRRGVTPRTVGRLIGRIVTGTGRALVASIVAFGRTLERAVEAAIRLANRTVKLLGDGIGGTIALVNAIGNGIVATGQRFVSTLRTLPARLHPIALIALLKGLCRSADESMSAIRGETASSDDAADADEETLTVQEAWSEFRRYVTVRSWRTSTPGEIAQWAARNDGLPADAVRTLRDAFRAVEYGDRPQEGLAPKVETALEKIRTSQCDDEEASES